MEKKTLEFIRCFEARRRESDRLNALPPGTYEGEVPGFPGLIDRYTALKETMDFIIPRWEDFSTDPAAKDTVSVWMWPLNDPEPADPFTTLSLDSPPPTGVPINIALARRTHGIHYLKYSVYVESVKNESESLRQPLIVDLAGPYYSHVGPIPAPLPPADLPTPATLAYFQGLPNATALFTVPGYGSNGQADGDYALLYYNNSDTPYLPTAGSSDPKWVLPANLTIPLPLSVVQGSEDGLRSLRYELYDAAGNPARLSSQFVFDVALFPEPTNFKAPTIDLAVPGDQLIDRDDAAQLNGAIIRIPAYDNYMRGNDGDVLSVTLTTSLGSQTLPDVPLGNNLFPVTVHAEYPTLLQIYGATQGELEMTVSYVVKRRSVSHNALLTAMTNLDLFVVGPTNPDEPSLINPNLNPAVVRGEDATGIEGADNELTPEHANRPANVHIRLWHFPPTPDAGPFTIYFYYEGVLADTLFVPNGTALQDVVMHIPWSIIASHGNGTMRVYYTIGSTGSSNRQYSSTTLVEVTANIISLRPPIIQKLLGDGAGFLNCTSFEPALGNILVHAPASEHFALNMIVRLHWRGYRDDLGTDEVTEVYGFKDSPPLTQTELNGGIDFKLEDYFTRFKPIQATRANRTAGSARVYYTIMLHGELVTSAEATPLVRGHLIGGPNGIFCDGTPVPA